MREVAGCGGSGALACGSGLVGRGVGERCAAVMAESKAPGTLGELRSWGYRYRPVKAELRENAMRRLRAAGREKDERGAGEVLFPGVMGYEDSVLPQIVQAVLSGHDLLLLGLRGQAKTRILRGFTGLLDEWAPIIDAPGVDVPDDPVHPTTSLGRRVVAERGDETPIRWLHRSERYHEKLATPDVTIADLIGEIDLVKHAEGRYLTDESTMHFGLVPRSNRGLFVINELPDLAPRIQVGLFNVLEERDVQIRGYPIRLDLDCCLMFSANPEDYTNRGRIVTPLKDRIGSVVRTHYPESVELSMAITRGSAFVDRRGGFELHGPNAEAAPDAGSAGVGEPAAGVEGPEVEVPRVMHEVLEEMVRQARTSPHINQASGVSVRASIAALECVVSAAEVRGLKTGAGRVVVRPSDTSNVAAALRGKVELMLSEESPDGQSTEDRLIYALLGEAVKAVVGRAVELEAVEPIAERFGGGLRLDLDDETTGEGAVSSMRHVDGLVEAAESLARRLEMDAGDAEALACCGELVLEFLYVNNRLSKVMRRGGSGYRR